MMMSAQNILGSYLQPSLPGFDVCPMSAQRPKNRAKSLIFGNPIALGLKWGYTIKKRGGVAVLGRIIF